MDSLPALTSAPVRRRRHSPEFKASVIQACRQPNASVSAIALAHGLNANMVRRWHTESARDAGSLSGALCAVSGANVPTSHRAGFVPLALPRECVPGEIRIEVQRAGTTMKIVWPVGAAGSCAAWLREWLG